MEDAARYEIKTKFPAQFPGVCTLDYDHKVKRGDFVSKIQYADNPMVPIQGVACKRCTDDIKMAHA